MHRVSTSTGWHFTFVLCCHSNETRALIANLPNSACTTRGHSYHSPKLHPFPCSSVGMRWGRDRHTDMQMCVINIHFASSTTHTKCKYTTTTTTTILLPFLLDHPGETVPEENFWTLWCQGRLTESDTPTIPGHHSIRTNQCPPPPSPIFTGWMPPTTSVKALKW